MDTVNICSILNEMDFLNPALQSTFVTVMPKTGSE
jgi:hypothetical protein